MQTLVAQGLDEGADTRIMKTITSITVALIATAALVAPSAHAGVKWGSTDRSSWGQVVAKSSWT